jgi:hypothetical protein
MFQHTVFTSEPAKFASNFHALFLQASFLICSHLRLGLQSCLFHLGFPANILYGFLIFPIYDVSASHFILLLLIIQKHFKKTVPYRIPHHAIVSTLPLLPLYQV